MEQTTPSNNTRNAIYIIAAVAAGALIIYGAIFYTKPSEQKAQIAPSSQEETNKTVEQITFEDPVLGDPNAPVTMIEYGSYLCGHCQAFGRTTFKQIEEKYINTGKVKFIYRSYPPLELGMALGCANEKNKYWDYHHYLLSKDIKNENDLAKFAGEIGLNQEEFNQCILSNKYQTQTQNWYQQGQTDDVQGTPTFLINDKQIVGNLPYSEFERVIKEALGK